MRVLVIESHAITAAAIQAVLEAAGHAVLGPVPSVPEALRVAETNPPDVALLDLGFARGDTGTKLAGLLYDLWGIRSVFVIGPALDAERGTDRAQGVIEKSSIPGVVLDAVRAAATLMASDAPAGTSTRLERIDTGNRD